MADLSPEMVLAELEKILSSAAFVNTNRLGAFLRFVVTQTIQGNADALKEYHLGLEVFGRPESYDPRQDPVVRVGARQLRFKLEEYYREFGATDDIIISLPKGRYVPKFDRREIPEAVPEPSRAPTAAPPRRWGLLLVAAIAVIIFAGVAYVRSRLSAISESRSIAVLPFKNIADPANQYFADGFTDELTAELARIHGFRVIARSSVSAASEKITDIRQIGRELGVANVLEGTVQHSGDRVKIVARMERVSDGAIEWSNSFDRRSGESTAIQIEITQAIGRQLNAAVLPEHGYVPTPEAHDEVLKGIFELSKATDETSLASAEADFERAIRLDPSFADAYSMLGVAKFDRAVVRQSLALNPGEKKEIEDLAHKALKLDPRLPEARALLATLAMQFDWDWKGAEREFKESIDQVNDANVLQQYAFLLCFEGRFAEADEMIRRSEDLDPISPTTFHNQDIILSLEGRYREAREIAQRTATLSPSSLDPLFSLSLSYLNEKKPDQALPYIRKIEERQPAPLMEAGLEAVEGHREKALEMLQPFEEKYPDIKVAPSGIAAVYARLGDAADTAKWLQRAADAHEGTVLNSAVAPVYASVRKSPEFQALLKRIGLDGVHVDR